MESSPEALRKALDEVERLRRRSLLIVRFLLFTFLFFLLASMAMFLLRENAAMGMVFSLLTLVCLIGASAIDTSMTSYRNTQLIVRMIELHSAPRSGE